MSYHLVWDNCFNRVTIAGPVSAKLHQLDALPSVTRLFNTLLVQANLKERYYPKRKVRWWDRVNRTEEGPGHIYKAGTRAWSLKGLGDACGRGCRAATTVLRGLRWLARHGFIQHSPTPGGTIITILGFEHFKKKAFAKVSLPPAELSPKQLSPLTRCGYSNSKHCTPSSSKHGFKTLPSIVDGQRPSGVFKPEIREIRFDAALGRYVDDGVPDWAR